MRTLGPLACAALLAAQSPPAPRPAGHRLYACAITSRGYVVGAKLPPSGLFRRDADGMWRQLGFNHPYLSALDYDPRDPRVLYLAAGNGCIRSADGGHTWRILTGWDITEPRGISVDPHAPDHLYLAAPDGIAVSLDQGRTWERRQNGLRRAYTQVVRVDRTRADRVLAGTESGIYLSGNGGVSWYFAGLDGAMVTGLAQSPLDPQWWLAITQGHGAFASRDGGINWTHIRSIPDGSTLYSVAFDPGRSNRVALAGWSAGVRVSEDGGRTWSSRNAGLPARDVWRVAFDPDHPGHLYASVHEQAVYQSPDAGLTWQSAGLPGTVVFDFLFVPEVP